MPGVYASPTALGRIASGMTISLRNATARERRRLENADLSELDPCELGLRR